MRGGAVLVEGAGGGGAAAGGGGGATAGAPHDRGVRAEPGSTTTPCKLISAPCVLYLMPPRPRRTAPLSPGCCEIALLSFLGAGCCCQHGCCHPWVLLSFRVNLCSWHELISCAPCGRALLVGTFAAPVCNTGPGDNIRCSHFTHRHGCGRMIDVISTHRTRTAGLNSTSSAAAATHAFVLHSALNEHSQPSPA